MEIFIVITIVGCVLGGVLANIADAIEERSNAVLK